MGSRTSSGHPTEGFHVCGGKLNSALTPPVNIVDVHRRVFFSSCMLDLLFSQRSPDTSTICPYTRLCDTPSPPLHLSRTTHSLHLHSTLTHTRTHFQTFAHQCLHPPPHHPTHLLRHAQGNCHIPHLFFGRLLSRVKASC